MSIGGILGYINLKIVNKNINNALSIIGLGFILLIAWVIN